MNYIQINIEVPNSELNEILLAELTDMGFNGFEENDNLLTAYINENDYNNDDFKSIAHRHNLKYSKQIHQDQNWNKVWESNFSPVIVDDFVGIRADFHQPILNVMHEIIITPKMSFGTGHHATTYMMMQLMQTINFNNKTVYDFGTGTGILAILAEKLGAKMVLAVDNDIWSVENARENFDKNKCKTIDLKLVKNADSNFNANIILANVNKNIINNNIKYLAKIIENQSLILLSGLLVNDESDIINLCNLYGFKHDKTIEKNGWIALWFKN